MVIYKYIYIIMVMVIVELLPCFVVFPVLFPNVVLLRFRC